MEDEALEFASRAHDGQMRKYSDEAYIEHPKRVAGIVKTVPHTSEMICAAYLHDVVEDTAIEIEEIREQFGDKVAALVAELTDEYMKQNYPHLNRKARKQKEVERQAGMSREAKTIKLADVIDNTMDIVKNDTGFARKYLKEMEALTQVLSDGDNTLYARASKEVAEGKRRLNIK
ncbi:HD domain-containing protein [Salinimicrobium oceani]|uniref:Bifunctional (P)ppGpp synthetase/guanosine-3',5'-bis(Diphosphate) 3'-pyrophosphohydrolase n=1 Tax=Salinimicrobium oceani TaxID=2722702 RepID=A0ABX1CYS1_9FLAO|nr:HD domain-containing protein [Salinimicrobium oceani]NJW52089.1 bifunctional (p)ppGpp synthetase/guanosine-3',5'-bis(diphosphate) 3'-pyrophosphohydrolase [Salinimicrobium oceani]